MLAPYWAMCYVSGSGLKKTDLVYGQKITTYCLGGRYISSNWSLAVRGEAGYRRVHVRDITSNNVKHRISNHRAAGRCRSSARDDSYCPLNAEKTQSCCSKQSCCIKTHDPRANHKRCWPSTQTTSQARNARMCYDHPAMGSQTPTHTSMARRDICGVVVLCPTAAQRGGIA